MQLKMYKHGLMLFSQLICHRGTFALAQQMESAASSSYVRIVHWGPSTWMKIHPHSLQNGQSPAFSAWLHDPSATGGRHSYLSHPYVFSFCFTYTFSFVPQFGSSPFLWHPAKYVWRCTWGGGGVLSLSPVWLRRRRRAARGSRLRAEASVCWAAGQNAQTVAETEASYCGCAGNERQLAGRCVTLGIQRHIAQGGRGLGMGGGVMSFTPTVEAKHCAKVS